MSDTGKMISKTISTAVAAFDEAIATVKTSGNYASNDLLDAIQRSFNSLASLARELEHLV